MTKLEKLCPMRGTAPVSQTVLTFIEYLQWRYVSYGTIQAHNRISAGL